MVGFVVSLGAGSGVNQGGARRSHKASDTERYQVAQIDVRTTPEGDEGWAFQVTVSEGGGQTSHRVTMSRNTYQQLTGEVCTPEELVRRSFEFLLEREPRESILREFEITVISRYFPDYEHEISKRIRP
jgi:hypothetical protein